MGQCLSKKDKNKRRHERFFSLQIRPQTPRLSTDIISELKKGMTIDRKKYLNYNQHQKRIYQRHPDDLDCRTAEITRDGKTKQEISDIKSSLLGHFLFRGLTKDIMEELIDDMNCYNINKHETIFKQGDSGYNFFIISSGVVEVWINDYKVANLERGQAFGELALLYGSPRRASIISVSHVRLWGLGRDDFRRIITFGNKRHYMENKTFLSSIKIFKKLTESQLEALLAALIIEIFNPGEKIISIGENRPEIYLIKEGLVNIYNKNKHIAYLGKGEYFGEQALIYERNRNASVKAVSRTVLLTFSNETIRKTLGDKIENVLYANTIRIAFSQDEELKKLTSNQISRIIRKITVKEVDGKIIHNPSEELWVVIKGEVFESGKKYTSHTCIATEHLLIPPFPMRNETIVNDVVIGIISRDKIEKALNSNLKTCFYYNKILESLKNSYILKLICETKLEELSKSVMLEKYGEGECIFKEGEKGDRLYIIVSGSVNIIKFNGVINILKKGDFFGERALLFEDPRTATTVAVEKCEFWTITRTSFLEILDDNLKKYLIRKAYLQDATITLDSLCTIKFLGSGTYSNVYLMKKEETSIEYALKVISKETIVKYNLLDKYINEKHLHLRFDFPFITHLVKTFKNESALFFLYENISGPSLSSVLVKMGSINLKRANFYASVILLILKYLHSKSIVHREIVPDNFNIDELGYPILTHFTSSKYVNGRTYSLVGIPHYMAPEIIKGDGYNIYADIWSFGVMIYEMLYGLVPFGEGEEDPFIIYKLILEEPLKYPVFIKESMKLNGLLEQLLEKVPSHRGTAESIMEHEWFDGNPWDSLLSKSYMPEFNLGLIENESESEKQDTILLKFESSEIVSWAEGF